jgi:hypothetical protein
MKLGLLHSQDGCAPFGWGFGLEVRAAALGRLLIFSTKPVLVVRGIWGGIIDVTMLCADSGNLAVCEIKGRIF